MIKNRVLFHHKKNKCKAFTLIEMVVYIFVVYLIVTICLFGIIWFINSNNKLKTTREVIYTTNRVLSLMTHEIREAKEVSTSTPVNYLSLKKVDNSFVDFFLSSSTIYQKINSEEIALTPNNVEVKKLNFEIITTSTSTPSVRICLRIDYKNPNNRPEYQYSFEATTTVSLRNY